MTCKINHSDPLCIPACLCRNGCGDIHTRTPAEVRAADKLERKAIDARIKRDSIARQARLLELKIEKLTPNGREPREGTIPAKLIVSYRAQYKKLKRALGKPIDIAI